MAQISSRKDDRLCTNSKRHDGDQQRTFITYIPCRSLIIPQRAYINVLVCFLGNFTMIY
jgi:hypothetical protein